MLTRLRRLERVHLGSSSEWNFGRVNLHVCHLTDLRSKARTLSYFAPPSDLEAGVGKLCANFAFAFAYEFWENLVRTLGVGNGVCIKGLSFPCNLGGRCSQATCAAASLWN